MERTVRRKNQTSNWSGLAATANIVKINTGALSLRLLLRISHLSLIGTVYNSIFQEQDEKIVKQIKSLTHYGKTIGDFSETAALCTFLDRVVSVDTSIAHLAGAIGCDVDLMLSHSADARWHATGNKSPWYSRMRIHRKNMNEEWSSFFKSC